MGENNEKIIKKLIKDTAKEVVKELKGNVFKEAAKEVVNELKSNNMIKKEMSYYKRVELLLYNYENLKHAVRQKEEDIEYIDKHGLPESSKSVVKYNLSGGLSKEDRYVQLKEKYAREKIETERDLKRIDNALDKIKKDRYYDIIKLKYLNSEEEKVATDEMLADVLKRDRSTIIRNRKRLINKLITILFPESIKDVI
ncbi:hypothetical protein [Clostridium sp. D53t1_180928_C8]|uniref:hypothetical protein n=1 Tax=Clostridium sp. D53t1_180928_C8 TaxID=2787101 RepID=UPI0018AB15E2|nr:hypothetical protein [Clostridium sp. D53t1_180928_C8]